jgi:WhiB family redox-sensing transcriptional regulator
VATDGAQAAESQVTSMSHTSSGNPRPAPVPKAVEVKPLLAMWDWQADAACRGMDASVFFSPPSERGEAKQAREEHAQQICRTCPVRSPCGLFAVATRQPYGVWGGLTERQRAPRGRRPRA